jgi:hypothetical protein
MGVAEKLAALAAKYNVETDELESENDDAPERVKFRGEALLYALEYPLQPRVTHECKECGDPFSSYYKNECYCSRLCLIRALRKVGIEWKPNGNLRKESWERRAEPKQIPLKALQAMKAIVAQAEADLGYEIVLPEIAAFVPKQTYFPTLEQPRELESYRIAVSPTPEAHSVEAEPSSASSLPQDQTSGNSAVLSAQSPEPIQSSQEPDPLEELFAL